MNVRLVLTLLLTTLIWTGQVASSQTVNIDLAADAKEQAELSQAVGEAGSSSLDLIHALEAHLRKYPDTKQRPAIEKALAKAAMDTNDNARIILYGEHVLANEAPPDLRGDVPPLLDRVTRALVDKEDPEQAKRALALTKRYETDVAETRVKVEPPGHLTPGQWSEELDKAAARALALEARATGYMGEQEAAAKIARESWKMYPTGEGAREVGWWLSKLGRNTEAVEFYANAFTLEDSRTTATDRARDRARLGTLYAAVNGSEKGLGDVVLEAYDRTSSLLSSIRANLKAKDPNAVAVNISDFILPPVDKTKEPLVLASLKGKTVVMDFWATWCAPCRAQQPLIEKVKKQYGSSPDVLFVAVDSDDDPTLAAPFAKEQGWESAGYFEAGLARQLNIASIPTVLILGPDGLIANRMIGFIPDRFEQMLAERVEDARKTATAK